MMVMMMMMVMNHDGDDDDDGGGGGGEYFDDDYDDRDDSNDDSNDDAAAHCSPAVAVMTTHHDLIMQPLYTSKMAQQNGECTNLDTDRQSDCCYPIAMVALLTLFSPCWTSHAPRPRFPKLHSGRSPTNAIPRWTSHTRPLAYNALHCTSEHKGNAQNYRGFTKENTNQIRKTKPKKRP